MIPDYIIECAARAVHEKHGQHIAPRYMDTPTWYRDDLEAQTATALEAVAADIWEQGNRAGFSLGAAIGRDDWTDEDDTNPYERIEHT
ncbi:hypothetical protein ACTXJ1_10210 [Brachybacterium alimentarium]|uniref:hypothetical protein n=1 Tax=Brachybacterium alimentarium TaxID=47845 RepID=UPI003FD11829